MLLNFDLLSVAISVASMAILGFVVFFHSSSNSTNRAFFYVCITTALWSTLNYITYSVTNNESLIIWSLRLSVFFAIFNALSLFNFFYTFPEKEKKPSKIYQFLLVPFSIVVSILTLTPYIFKEISSLSESGKINTVANGLLIPLFGLNVFFLIFGGFFIFLRKFFKFKGAERNQAIFILLGAIISFSLIVVFNFVFPALLNKPDYINLGAIFILPFVAFTAYTILKYGLFNVKIFWTSALVFVLAIVTFLEIIFSPNLIQTIFRTLVFLLVLTFGILILKSVLKEVKRREQFEKLTKLLGEATEKLEGANAQLTRLDQAKSDFISIASHQLRTPLTVIKGYISMMQEGSFGQVPQKINDHLTKVFLSNERLIKLVEDLLNISRIESGRQQFDWTKFDIVELVGRLTDSLVQNAKAKGLKLTFHAPKTGKIEVTAEYNKLHDVMINFIDNAIKYTVKGQIDVTVELAPKDMVTIRVKDTGRGLDAITKDALFQKFARAEGSFQVNAGGSGLGLYVARVIVEAHEGKAWAESEGLGKGSSFCFAIPITGPKNRAALPFASAGQKVDNPIASSTQPIPSAPPAIIKK